MALPLILIGKGLLVLGKAIAGKAVLVKATGVLIAKSIATYGISATISATLTVGAVVGGVVWTEKRIKHLRKAFKALENDNLEDAIYYFASLLNAIKGIDVDDLADTVETCLIGIGTSYSKAGEVHDLIQEFGGQITATARQLK